MRFWRWLNDMTMLVLIGYTLAVVIAVALARRRKERLAFPPPDSAAFAPESGLS